jgi:hypothetical protein
MEDTQTTNHHSLQNISLQNTMGAVTAHGNEDGNLQCCCGKEDCVFLVHNCSVLSSVERDVHTAARMGQVSHSATFL